MSRRAVSVVLGVALLVLAVALAARGARPVGAEGLLGMGAPVRPAGMLAYLVVGGVVGAGSSMLVVAIRMGVVRRRRV